MPKKLLKRYLPNPEKVKKFKGFGFMGKWLHNPNIWHLNRHSVSKSFIIGLFWMSIPVPSQMVMAALSALYFRANLPLSVALVWISNPLTMAPIFYFNYFIGSLLLGEKVQEKVHFELSWHWIMHTLGDLWMPLYLGSFLVGTTLALIAYFATQLFWKYHVLKQWSIRKNKIDNK